MKKYKTPTMNLHELKTGRVMAASIYKGESPSENANEKYVKSSGLEWEDE